MPDQFTPRKVVKLAKPGQLPGVGRPAPDYREAMPLAYANPGEPVIVHEFDIPLGGNADEQGKLLQRHVATEIREALESLNESGEVPEVEVHFPADVEPWQVSQATIKAENVIRTFVVFHKDGRPKRARRTKGSAPAELTDAEQAEADAATARGEALPTADPPTTPSVGARAVFNDVLKEWDGMEWVKVVVAETTHVGTDEDEEPF